jgi:hypothetical protein
MRPGGGGLAGDDVDEGKAGGDPWPSLRSRIRYLVPQGHKTLMLLADRQEMVAGAPDHGEVNPAWPTTRTLMVTTVTVKPWSILKS